MRCEHIQDLLLTDYIDGQLEQSVKKHIDTHLEQCSSCREFLQVVQKNLLEPLAQVHELDVPSRVWQNIEEKIHQREQSRNIFEQLRDFILGHGPITKPALAFASLLLLVLAIGALQQFKIHQTIQMQQQIEYLGTLSSFSVDPAVNSREGFGTTIEQFFL